MKLENELYVLETEKLNAFIYQEGGKKAKYVENRGNWAKLTFAKTCRTVSKDKGKNWRIADRRVPSNDPRNNCETYSYKVTNFMCHQIVWNIF